MRSALLVATQPEHVIASSCRTDGSHPLPSSEESVANLSSSTRTISRALGKLALKYLLAVKQRVERELASQAL
jgi:hypothetical protein